MTKFIYLATPYSHKDAEVMEQRYEVVTEVAAAIMRATGYNVFSPITHSHPMVKHGLPTSTEWWLQHDWAYIDMADELYVLCQDGWDVSKGVAREVRYAQMLIGSKERIPVRYYEVEDWLGID